MILDYTIVANPDSESPKEQGVGNFIQDDRLYGIAPENIVLVTQTTALNKEQFGKPKYSNKLTVLTEGFVFGLGTFITITTA